MYSKKPYLGISSIAWSREIDGFVFQNMKMNKIKHIEIVPAMLGKSIYEEEPIYLSYMKQLEKQFEITPFSMQSILFGFPSAYLFENHNEGRRILLEVFQYAILRARALKIPVIVFGSPKNRIISEPAKEVSIAVQFFRDVASFAKQNRVTVCIEPNPTIYGGNFLTTTQEAINFIKEVNNNGVSLQLDLGTIIANKENFDHLLTARKMLQHCHISNPYLKTLSNKYSDYYDKLFKFLKDIEYSKGISIEMLKEETIDEQKLAITETFALIKQYYYQYFK